METQPMNDAEKRAMLKWHVTRPQSAIGADYDGCRVQNYFLAIARYYQLGRFTEAKALMTHAMSHHDNHGPFVFYPKRLKPLVEGVDTSDAFSCYTNEEFDKESDGDG